MASGPDPQYPLAGPIRRDPLGGEGAAKIEATALRFEAAQSGAAQNVDQDFHTDGHALVPVWATAKDNVSGRSTVPARRPVPIDPAPVVHHDSGAPLLPDGDPALHWGRLMSGRAARIPEAAQAARWTMPLRDVEAAGALTAMFGPVRTASGRMLLPVLRPSFLMVISVRGCLGRTVESGRDAAGRPLARGRHGKEGKEEADEQDCESPNLNAHGDGSLIVSGHAHPGKPLPNWET